LESGSVCGGQRGRGYSDATQEKLGERNSRKEWENFPTQNRGDPTSEKYSPSRERSVVARDLGRNSPTGREIFSRERQILPKSEVDKKGKGLAREIKSSSAPQDKRAAPGFSSSARINEGGPT